MERSEALSRLYDITHGIELTEGESDLGWWETSTGATFGEGILGKLEKLIVELTED